MNPNRSILCPSAASFTDSARSPPEIKRSKEYETQKTLQTRLGNQFELLRTEGQVKKTQRPPDHGNNRWTAERVLSTPQGFSGHSSSGTWQRPYHGGQTAMRLPLCRPFDGFGAPKQGDVQNELLQDKEMNL